MNGSNRADHTADQSSPAAGRPAELSTQSPIDSSPPQARAADPTAGHQAIEHVRRLRLELRKTRSQADAARLEARAAELELQINRLTGAEPDGQAPGDGPPLANPAQSPENDLSASGSSADRPRAAWLRR